MRRLLCFACLLGCELGRLPGDGGAPNDGPDATAVDAADVSTDAGTAPRVVATFPADGASAVPLDVAIAVAFSERMREGGALVLRDELGEVPLGAIAAGPDGTTVTATPLTALAPGQRHTLTVARSFTSVAGVSLESDVEIVFFTEDRVAPFVVRTTPSEGDTVDAAITLLELEASEPLRADRGSALLLGAGAPVLGPPTFAGATVRWSVADLIADAPYELAFTGFEDLAGNPLDVTALGADARLDFSTGPDLRRPTVVDSVPREGQLDVEVALLTRIVVAFSEPMADAGSVTLEGPSGARTALPATLSADGMRLGASVRGLLDAEAPHRVLLEGFLDAAGNPLDGTMYLGDGALDFTTGTDALAPFVAFAEPEEGDLDVAPGTDRVVLTFSEAMPELPSTVVLVGDGRSVTLEGTWSAGGTILSLPAPMLQAGRRYEIDVRGFRDLGGTALDATHPYLGDGIVTFELGPPSGERCGDALTESDATPLGTGGFLWTLPAGAVSAHDGGIACDLDGHSPDALVRYRKVRDETILHVVVDAATSQPLDVEVDGGACRRAADGTDAMLRCLPERAHWETWLAAPAGDHFVWVATDASATFRGASVLVEEIGAAREGESCLNPLTVGGALHTPPDGEGGFHTWVLPADFPGSPDRGAAPDDPEGALSCPPAAASLGHDAVIHWHKRTDTSLVTIRATLPAGSALDGAGIEVARGCAPGDPSYAPLACFAYDGSALLTERTFDGPAGPLAVWIVEQRDPPLPGGAWRGVPETRIEILEVEPGPGDSCATAIPLAPGTVTATAADRTTRAHVPSCLSDGGVTWFRYTPSERLGLVRADGASLAAVLDAEDGRLLRCGDDIGDVVPVFAEPGRDVCLAVASSPGITAITIDELPYRGVLGHEAEVPLVRPPGAPTTPLLTASGWMAVSGGLVFRGGTSLFFGPVGGGSYDWLVPGAMCRFAGVAAPGGLYCVADRITPDGPRLYRMIDETGAITSPPLPIDVPGVPYPDGRRLGAIAWDGERFVAGSANESVLGTSTTPTSYFAIELDGGVTAVGTNDAVHDVAGIAADATFVYVAGRANGVEGIFRLRRDRLDDPSQLPVELDAGIDVLSDDGTIAIDDTGTAHALYYRTSNAPRSDVRVIVDPAAALPSFRGILWRAAGTAQNGALGYDAERATLWLLDTNAGSSPRWLRLR